MDLGGAVVLTPDAAETHYHTKRLQQLIRVGGKLAVLGVEDGPRAMGWWHVARPGSWDPPKDSSGIAPDGGGLTYAKALCNKYIVTNGYAADWRPPPGSLCPACAEQI